MENTEVINWLNDILKKVSKVDFLLTEVDQLKDRLRGNDYEIHQLKAFRSAALQASLDAMEETTGGKEVIN